jgi:hypothetical protein
MSEAGNRRADDMETGAMQSHSGASGAAEEV